MFTRISRFWLAGLAMVVVAAPVALFVVLALGRSSGNAGLLGGERLQLDFWRSLVIQAVWAEQYDSLKDMREAADAVVIGKIESFDVSRVHQGDALEDIVVFGKMAVSIGTLVSGRADDKVEVEFVMSQPPETAAAAVDLLNENRPDDDIMLFLREKKRQPGLHRVVNDLGLWVLREGTLTAPLSFDAPDEEADRFGSGAGRYQSEIADARSLEDLAVVVFR